MRIEFDEDAARRVRKHWFGYWPSGTEVANVLAAHDVLFDEKRAMCDALVEIRRLNKINTTSARIEVDRLIGALDGKVSAYNTWLRSTTKEREAAQASRINMSAFTARRFG